MDRLTASKSRSDNEPEPLICNLGMDKHKQQYSKNQAILCGWPCCISIMKNVIYSTTILILIIFFFTFSRTCAGLLKVHYAAWRVYHLQGCKTQKIRERHRDSTRYTQTLESRQVMLMCITMYTFQMV